MPNEKKIYSTFNSIWILQPLEITIVVHILEYHLCLSLLENMIVIKLSIRSCYLMHY